jgi:hypothetical protein
MFWAHLETDVGEQLRVLRPDGTIGGKAILSFIVGIENYCMMITASVNTSQEESHPDMQMMLQWFAKLELHTHQPICSLTQLLQQAYYSGDWSYNENEYNWFLHQQPEFGKALSEEKFKETIRQVNQKWVDAGMLFANINKLIRALLEADLQNTWWYASKHSETDFQALAYTLSLAIQRGAEQVRIKII